MCNFEPGNQTSTDRLKALHLAAKYQSNFNSHMALVLFLMQSATLTSFATCFDYTTPACDPTCTREDPELRKQSNRSWPSLSLLHATFKKHYFCLLNLPLKHY